MLKNAICHTKKCPPLFSDVENGLWKKCTKLAIMHGVHNLGNLSRVTLASYRTLTYKWVLKLAWLVKMPTIVIWLKNNYCHFATLACINCSATDCTSMMSFFVGVILIITYFLLYLVYFFLWQHSPCAFTRLSHRFVRFKRSVFTSDLPTLSPS